MTNREHAKDIIENWLGQFEGPIDRKPLEDAITAALRSAESDLLKRMMEPSEDALEAANREWDGRMSVRSTGVWQAMLTAFATENNIDIGLETEAASG